MRAFTELTFTRWDRVALAVLLPLLGDLACSSSGSVVLLQTVAPPFPDTMAQAHQEGEVVVRVAVEPDGVVSDARVIKFKGDKRVFPIPSEYERVARQWLFGTSEKGLTIDIHFVYELLDSRAPEAYEGVTLLRPNRMVLRRRKPLTEPTTCFVKPVPPVKSQ